MFRTICVCFVFLLTFPILGSLPQDESHGLLEYVQEVTGKLDDALLKLERLEKRLQAVEARLGIKVDSEKPQPEDVKNNASAEGSSESANTIWDKAAKAVFSKELDVAEKYFAEFLKSYQKDDRAPQAYYWLGEIETLRKNITKAQGYYAQAFKQIDVKNKLKTEVGVKLAESYFAQNKHKEGCLFLKEVLKLQQSGCEVSAATTKILENYWLTHKCG